MDRGGVSSEWADQGGLREKAGGVWRGGRQSWGQRLQEGRAEDPWQQTDSWLTCFPDRHLPT